MQSNDTLKLKGSMTAVLFKEDGTTETYLRDNIIVKHHHKVSISPKI